MALPTLPPLREVIARHGLNAKKSLGQNFLTDTNLLDRIARIPGLGPESRVYEVGPGPGGLTRALLRTGALVFAVERDDRALDPRALAGDGAHIVANLPYNIGTALFTGWLESPQWPPWWASLTLMFQKEVAQRIIASPGDDAYGRLAVLAQWRSTPKIALTLPARAFVPAPKVESAVVHLVPTTPLSTATPARLAALTAAAFGQRRKMLRASLKGLPGALEAMEAEGIKQEARAETVPVEAFANAAARLG
jgi:16S rRNA (adenine1518-N6/adenine1519-N6)-dimethyltransferase